MIARRTVPLTGEVNESSWEAGKYSIGGNDVMETITNIQRDVFAFVADFDKEVTVTFTVGTVAMRILITGTFAIVADTYSRCG